MRHFSFWSTMTLCAMISIGCSMRSEQARTTAPPPGPVQAATAEPGVIPAGTRFTIRTNEAITAKEAGKTFSAEVAQDIQDQSERVLVPRGSTAELVVVQVSGGGVAGTPTMELAIRSVTANGRRYAISTGGLTEEAREGLGRNRRTAEMVGGGALLGTLIGAVAGGGKGAAIGAVAGAAGGATAQVLTRGSEIRVPAETILTFELNQPWRLEGYSG